MDEEKKEFERQAEKVGQLAAFATEDSYSTEPAHTVASAGYLFRLLAGQCVAVASVVEGLLLADPFVVHAFVPLDPELPSVDGQVDEHAVAQFVDCQ